MQIAQDKGVYQGRSDGRSHDGVYHAIAPHDSSVGLLQVLRPKAVFKNALDDGIKHRLNLRRHTQVYEKLELLKQKHTDIAEFIAHDYGRELQYHDSCVLEQLINLFTDMDIPILTVHDSIICQARYKDFVREKMQQFFTEYINEVFDCAVEHNPQHAHTGAVSRTPEHIKALPVGYSMKAHPITQWNIKAISKHIESAKSYEGRIPTPQNNVIEVPYPKFH